MKVRQLLAEKAGPVQSVAPEDMIHGVAKILKEKKIGLDVVCGPDGEIVGVLSKRDIVRGFAEKGAAIMDVKVTDLMTKDVLTAGLADDSSAILRKLWINNVRHMPVVQDGALVGILSVRDLMKSLTQEDGTRAQDILLDVLREGRYYPGA
jgi:CBS domain-containing protein